MISYSPARKFASVWQKYRPAILRLMVDAEKGPQQYKFSPHEFKRLNPYEKKGYGFTLTFHKNKSVNNIRASEIANDLLMMLQASPTATGLSEQNTFEFILDKSSVLHVLIAGAEKAAEPEGAASSPETTTEGD